MSGKNSPEKLLTELLKLEPIEFLGVCKIIGVDVYDMTPGDIKDVKETGKDEQVEGTVDVDVKPRQFCDIWYDVCDIIGEMNRIKRRNLGKLIYAATKKEKK